MIETLRSKPSQVHWLIFIVLLIAFLFINLPFLTPLIIAGIFALGMNDFVNNMSLRLRTNRKVLVLVSMFCGLALFWIPITLAIYRIIEHVSQPQNLQTDRIAEQAHVLKNFILNFVQKISTWTGTDLTTPARGVMESLIQKAGSFVLTYSTEFLGQLPAILLSSFVFIITLLVLLLKAAEVRKFFLKFSPVREETSIAMINVSKQSCSTTLFSTLVIGLIQAMIIGIGSLIFGEGDFWLVLAITFFVSFIPVIGAAPVGYVLCLLAYLGDRMGAAVGLFIVATLAGTIDNILKPFMMGSEFKINAVIGFTCVVGAIIMLGLPGLLIGPVVMNLFVGLSPVLLKKS